MHLAASILQEVLSACCQDLGDQLADADRNRLLSSNVLAVLMQQPCAMLEDWLQLVMSSQSDTSCYLSDCSRTPMCEAWLAAAEAEVYREGMVKTHRMDLLLGSNLGRSKGRLSV